MYFWNFIRIQEVEVKTMIQLAKYSHNKIFKKCDEKFYLDASYLFSKWKKSRIFFVRVCLGVWPLVLQFK